MTQDKFWIKNQTKEKNFVGDEERKKAFQSNHFWWSKMNKEIEIIHAVMTIMIKKKTAQYFVAWKAKVQSACALTFFGQRKENFIWPSCIHLIRILKGTI